MTTHVYRRPFDRSAAISPLLLPLFPAETIIAVGIASETDTAFVVGKIKTIVQAVETDTALAIGVGRSYAIVQASETDTAQVVHKAKSIVQASETDTAQVVHKAKSITLASETDTAFGVTAFLPIGAIEKIRILSLETRRFLVER